MNEVRRTSARVNNQIIGSATIQRRRRDRQPHKLCRASGQRNTRSVKSNRKPCSNRRGVQGQSSRKRIQTVQTDSCRRGVSLRNRLGKRRSGNGKVARGRGTVSTVYRNVWGGDRRSVNHVVVDVNDRPSRPGNAFCECDVKEQTVARGETTETENLFMSYAWAIQARNTSYSGIIDTVDILTRGREDNVNCRNTRDGKLSWIHLDEYVKAVEIGHT